MSRVRRTRDALGDALLALMSERAFDDVTVQDVLDRAGVGRSTFYVHYRDKHDLFTSDIDEFWSLVAQRRVGEDRIAAVRELFEHAADAGPLLETFRRSGKLHDVLELGIAHFARAIDERLGSMPRTRHLPPARRTALAHAQAGAILAMLEWWLSAGQPLPAADVDELFHRTFWRGVLS